MKIGKWSLILYTCAAAAFGAAVYLLVKQNLTAGMVAVCLAFLCVISGSMMQAEWKKNQMLVVFRKNFEKEKANLRKTIQKQEKEIEVLQDLLAENMTSSINRTTEKNSTELINLTEEAGLAVEKYQPFANLLDIRIQVSATEDEIEVQADTNHIRKIFSNILENSLKYMKSEGVIVITLSKIENQAFMVIKDNGQGCSKDQIENIFDKFYQREIIRM